MYMEKGNIVKKLRKAEVVVFLALFVTTVAFSASQNSSIETYLEQLHSQGRERVIVQFENETDIGVIDKYDTRLIRKLKIINALVCEIDHPRVLQALRSTLKKELDERVAVRLQQK